jgi:hypothetical protein
MSDPSRTPLSCTAIGARAEEIKQNSAEYRGIRPPLLADKPVARDLRRLNGAAPGERRK